MTQYREQEFVHFFYSFIIIVYSGILVTVVAIGRSLLATLKVHYPEFYKRDRSLILTQIIIFIISILARLVFSIYNLVKTGKI